MQTSFSSTRWPWATSIPMLLVSKGKLDELNIDKLFQVWESCSIWKLTMFWLQSTSASSQTRSSFLFSRISATWTSSPIVLSLTSNSRSTKISDRKDYPQSQAKDCNDVTFDASTISMLSNRWTSWWEQCTRCSGTQAWWWSSWPSQSSAKSSSLLTAITIITILLLVTRYAGTSRGRLCCRCLVTRTRSRRKRNRSDTSFLIIWYS